MSAEALIRRYRLATHPEGGWYREMHRSQERVSRSDGQDRSALTAILFLLCAGEVSRWHRVSDADESWHHAGGAPLELISLPPGGGEPQRCRLEAATNDAGPGVAPSKDPATPLAIVPAGWWQAAHSLGSWSLVSCCVGPGFDFADFTLLRELPPLRRPPGALPAFL